MGDVTSYEVEVVGLDGDAGTRHKVTCPECGESVLCAEMSWWPQVCKCGYRWAVDLSASGRKDVAD